MDTQRGPVLHKDPVDKTIDRSLCDQWPHPNTNEFGPWLGTELSVPTWSHLSITYLNLTATLQADAFTVPILQMRTPRAHRH